MIQIASRSPATRSTRSSSHHRATCPPQVAVTRPSRSPRRSSSSSTCSTTQSLPESLDRLPLRPVDTLHRAALRENVPERPGSGTADPADLERALRSKIAFDSLSDDLDPFSTASLLSLDLPSIVRIRKSDAWRTYTSQLAGLVGEPEMFDTRADPVLNAYHEVLRLLARDRPQLPWQPVRQSHLEISGVTLKVTFSSRPSFQQFGEITGEPPPCQATVRLAMVNRLTHNKAGPAQDEAEPDLAFDALRASIADPKGLPRTDQANPAGRRLPGTDTAAESWTEPGRNGTRPAGSLNKGRQPGRRILVIRIRPELAQRPVMVQRPVGSGDDKAAIFYIPVRIPGGTRQATRAEMAALFAKQPGSRSATSEGAIRGRPAMSGCGWTGESGLGQVSGPGAGPR